MILRLSFVPRVVGFLERILCLDIGGSGSEIVLNEMHVSSKNLMDTNHCWC